MLRKPIRQARPERSELLGGQLVEEPFGQSDQESDLQRQRLRLILFLR